MWDVCERAPACPDISEIRCFNPAVPGFGGSSAGEARVQMPLRQNLLPSYQCVIIVMDNICD